jgi:hypothetical protein
MLMAKIIMKTFIIIFVDNYSLHFLEKAEL